MAKKWSQLYSRIPLQRREVVEAHVNGWLARMDRKPYDANPYNFDSQPILFRAWRSSYMECDMSLLGESNGPGAE